MEDDRSDGEELRGTAEDLRRHIQIRRTKGQEGMLFLPDFMLKMGDVLADRISNNPRGVNPHSYFMTVDMLVNDCRSGIDTVTGEPMPHWTQGLSESTLAAIALGSATLAREAFSDDFEKELLEVRTAHRAFLAQPPEA